MRVAPLALLCAVAIPLVFVSPDSRARAAGPKQFIKAQIKRDNVKFWKRTFIGSYTSNGFTFGASTKPKDLRDTVHGIGISCGSIDLETAVLPVTLENCAGSYVLAKPGRGGSKTWTSSGMTVTVKSYENGIVTVSFDGSIDALAPNKKPPVSVSRGTAVIRLTDSGF